MALQGRTRSTRGLVILLVAASLVTITVDYRQPDGPLDKLGDAALTVIMPMQEGVSSLLRPVTQFLSAVARLPSLERENRRLEDEIAGTRSDLIAFEALQAKVEDLEALLGLVQTLEDPVVAATVTSSSVSNFEWSVNINVGSGAGVEPGMAVVEPAGLVGRVVSVTPTGSKVRLLVDTEFRVPGRLIDSQHVGLIEGAGKSDLLMTFSRVSVDEVSVGEPVETAGFQLENEQSDYPPGVPIGSVTEVTQVPGLEEAEVRLRPYVDFAALDTVLVVQTVTR